MNAKFIKEHTEYTPEEQEELKRIDAEYLPRLNDAIARMNQLWQETVAHRSINAEEMAAASKVHQDLTAQWLEARGEITRKATARLLDRYKTSANAILNMIKQETPKQIAFLATISNADLQQETDESKDPTIYGQLFDDDSLRLVLHDAFKQYLNILERTAPETYQEAIAFIEDCITNKRSMIDISTTKTDKKETPVVTCRTRHPQKFITSVDKVSNKAFGVIPVFYGDKLTHVAVERKGSKKQIDTLVSINFDEMKAQGVEIYGNKELTTFDREVHDAIVTLAVEGENEYLTPQMIFQTMGNPRTIINPKQVQTISNSVTKMMCSLIYIDATKEAEAYGFESFEYEGSLIPCEKVTAKLNGKTVRCIHLYRIPPLYEYADRKNQVGRVDIKLLDIPNINMTEETLILRGYLLRRILAMKSTKNTQSNSIVYETIFNQLEVKSPNNNALRKKKVDVRKKVKTLLDYWKTEKFIKDYVETKKGQEIYSVTITVPRSKTPKTLGI